MQTPSHCLLLPLHTIIRYHYTKTLSSESTAALLKREDLKDDSSLVHNKLGGGRGMGLTMDEDGRTHSAASGAIQFQESDNAGMTRRGSTMTSSSDNTQSTYRLNVNIPRTGYYSEKDGFSHGHHGYDTNKSSPAHNLIIVSRTATTPTTPNTPHDSVFRQAGGNNSNSTPNGKRYIDTRKRNKQQRKEDKALAKASFNKRKTLFSNERTFIHWIKFGMLLGALAMTLLNFSGDEVARRGIDQTLANRVGKIGKNVGVTLLLVCLLSLLYAAVSYHWRHLGIVKDAGHRRYFDRVGPTFLTIALLATYTMNVVLTIQVSSLMDHNYEPSIYLNNNNNNPGSHAFPALTPPPQAATNEIESVTPSASPPPPSSALAHPKRPVFDTPFLPPGSTILVDSDEDDGSEFEFPDPPSDPDDPTVTTASSTTDPESGLRPSTEDSPTEPSSPSSSSTSSSESSSEKGSVPSNSVSRTGTDASSEYDWYTTMSGGSSSGDEDDNN
ncbi:hypothetical protein BG015_007268 [Linnemannia schmuckeri]|uniref:DUF202 domain-containing protein n=1 Tax=Linnemannia schmuckeri TaxID=64567 RepID=A0A9P5VF85_9FUNG|nr:hypothetical protein BG015_007268 [Linnemannia schmuckeri]